jgi:CheY-like chemotaxis protein
MTSLAPRTILVVEDDDTIRHVLQTFLELEGYAVKVAANGFQAIEMLKVGVVPNLILLDMKMPVMDGWQFASEFRHEFDGKSPIVVMTAAADAKTRANEISANGWIGKPFGLDELLEKVRKNIS